MNLNPLKGLNNLLKGLNNPSKVLNNPLKGLNNYCSNELNSINLSKGLNNPSHPAKYVTPKFEQSLWSTARIHEVILA